MLTVLISVTPPDLELNRTSEVSAFRFVSGNVHDPENQKSEKPETFLQVFQVFLLICGS